MLVIEGVLGRLVVAWQTLVGSVEVVARTDEVDRWNTAHEHTKRGLALRP
jgi:xanthine dehydrogenase molybdopterin-binding subunit B